VIEKPTLLEIFSYIFYFPTSIIGPSFEFSDFINFIYKRNEYLQIPKMRCIKAAMKVLLTTIVCMISYLVFKNKLDFFWVTSDEFAEKNLMYKFIYYMVSSALVIRAKYYSGFKLMESSVIFCGLSYNKKKIELKESNSEKTKEEYIDDFSKIESIRIYNFECEINPNEKVNYWNRTVHYWLKYQVFFRLINLEHKFFNKNFALASLIVFLISAVWHGFYPGYYLFFIQLYFIQQIAKMLEEKLDFFKKVKQSNLLVQIICNLISIFVIGSLGFAFCVLDVYKAIKFYKAFYFIPNLFVLLMYVYLKFFLRKKKHHVKDCYPNFEGYNILTDTKSGEEYGSKKNKNEHKIYEKKKEL
jgi:lysophospholipid acyltransferase